MKIELAEQVLGISREEIVDIITKHNLKVAKFINGRYDLTFPNITQIYNIKHGLTKSAAQIKRQLITANRGLLKEKNRREEVVSELKSARKSARSGLKKAIDNLSKERIKTRSIGAQLNSYKKRCDDLSRKLSLATSKCNEKKIRIDLLESNIAIMQNRALQLAEQNKQLQSTIIELTAEKNRLISKDHQNRWYPNKRKKSLVIA